MLLGIVPWLDRQCVGVHYYSSHTSKIKSIIKSIRYLKKNTVHLLFCFHILFSIGVVLYVKVLTIIH